MSAAAPMDPVPVDPEPTAPVSPSTGFPDRSAWDRPGFLLWHATARWQRRVADALAPLQLTHTQFVLLAGTAWLEADAGRPSQRELSEHAGTDTMTTSQVIRTLEERGLVQRDEDAADARVKRLHCTPVGLELAARAVAAVEHVDDDFFAPADERTASLQVLRRLAGRDERGGVVQ
jgi:DNA-binding MarR family transcriptional regulator